MAFAEVKGTPEVISAFLVLLLFWGIITQIALHLPPFPLQKQWG